MNEKQIGHCGNCKDCGTFVNLQTKTQGVKNKGQEFYVEVPMN